MKTGSRANHRAFELYYPRTAGQYPWIESIEDYSTTISDLDGGLASQGAEEISGMSPKYKRTVLS